MDNIITQTDTSKVSENTQIKSWGLFKMKLGGFFNQLKFKFKPVRGVFGTLALIAFLGAGVVLVQNVQNIKTQAGSVNLSLSTSNSSPRVGDTFTVAVAIDTRGLQVSAADIEIKYDESLFELVNGQVGNFLTVALAPLSRSPGTLVISLGAEPTNPKSGTGLLGQVSFRVKSTGSSSISLGPNTGVAAIGQASNAVGTLTPVQINVVGQASPTPEQPTPTPGQPTPTPGQTQGTPVLSNTGINTEYNPWAAVVVGTGFTSGLKARLIDTTGSQWGQDIGVAGPKVTGNSQWVSFQLPSNSPPSRCNVGRTCTIGVYLVTSTGTLSNRLDLTLPAN